MSLQDIVSLTASFQNIVFFVGAGFSAPFGLPVMNNFIDKAQQVYDFDPDNFKDFDGIFSLIDEYSRAKNYAVLNSYNLEESKLDQAITRAQREIKLIQEYRTRLIFDVVTEQANMRGIGVPEIDGEITEEKLEMEVKE